MVKLDYLKYGLIEMIPIVDNIMNLDDAFKTWNNNPDDGFVECPYCGLHVSDIDYVEYDEMIFHRCCADEYKKEEYVEFRVDCMIDDKWLKENE